MIYPLIWLSTGLGIGFMAWLEEKRRREAVENKLLQARLHVIIREINSLEEKNSSTIYLPTYQEKYDD